MLPAHTGLIERGSLALSKLLIANRGEVAVRVARAAAELDTGCDAIHPGYGFKAEDAAFALQCAEAGLNFVGPPVETLELLGDRGPARAFAASHGVPVLPGSDGPVNVQAARTFFDSLGEHGAMLLTAVAGGGGRGMRVVTDASEIEESPTRCQSEARTAFGNEAGYQGVGTFEFLVDLDAGDYVFIEANARLQVEHKAKRSALDRWSA